MKVISLPRVYFCLEEIFNKKYYFVDTSLLIAAEYRYYSTECSYLNRKVPTQRRYWKMQRRQTWQEAAKEVITYSLLIKEGEDIFSTFCSVNEFLDINSLVVSAASKVSLHGLFLRSWSCTKWKQRLEKDRGRWTEMETKRKREKKRQK